MSQPANDEFSQHLSDDEASNHEDASDTGAAPKQQQQVIPQTTAISNIKLPILKKEEYDIWAMEMEHYLEYIDNDVWKVIQNGNSKKRISTGKDGVIRILPPVTAAEIQAVEKERKAKNILLMAIPKEHMRRFHGMDDAKEIWEAIRTSSCGYKSFYFADVFRLRYHLDTSELSTDVEVEFPEASKLILITFVRNLNVTLNTQGDVYRLGKKHKCHTEYSGKDCSSVLDITHLMVTIRVFTPFSVHLCMVRKELLLRRLDDFVLLAGTC
ncbi:hypothetical protein Tco_0635593 [Tanacetum coccineum]